MSYHEQCQQWLDGHPDATIEEAWEAGYLTSLSNWCKKER